MDAATAQANGHTPVSGLRPLYPAQPWPQEPAAPGREDDPPAADRLRAAWNSHRGKVLKGIAGAVLLSTAASFYESFTGLMGWFERLGFRGFRAVIAPAMVDLVGVTGETIALVVIIDGRAGRTVRVLAWFAFAWGLVLSVVGNAGRDGFRPGLAGWFDMAWFAVPPLSLAIITSAALALAKLLLKPSDDSRPDGQDDAAAPSDDAPDDAEPDCQPDVTKPLPDRSPRRQPRRSKLARAAAVLKRNPGLADAEVMRRADVSLSTVQRARREANRND